MFSSDDVIMEFYDMYKYALSHRSDIEQFEPMNIVETDSCLLMMTS